jgi:hypothetical protein
MRLPYMRPFRTLLIPTPNIASIFHASNRAVLSVSLMMDNMLRDSSINQDTALCAVAVGMLGSSRTSRQTVSLDGAKFLAAHGTNVGGSFEEKNIVDCTLSWRTRSTEASAQEEHVILHR